MDPRHIPEPVPELTHGALATAIIQGGSWLTERLGERQPGATWPQDWLLEMQWEKMGCPDQARLFSVFGP